MHINGLIYFARKKVLGKLQSIKLSSCSNRNTSLLSLPPSFLILPFWTDYSVHVPLLSHTVPVNTQTCQTQRLTLLTNWKRFRLRFCLCFSKNIHACFHQGKGVYSPPPGEHALVCRWRPLVGDAERNTVQWGVELRNR